jgi:GGDEF domain-containing protein
MTQEFLIGFSRLIMWRLRDSDYCVQLGERSIWVMLPETTLEEGRDVATRLKREVSSYWWPRSMGGVRALPKIGIANWMLQEPITDWIDRAQASVKHPTIRSAGLS